MSSNALLAGVTGLTAHQTMLDVAGNNLANINTAGFKSSRVTFAEMLSNTIRQAAPPSATIGGTDPQQVGSGVTIGAINRNISQGLLLNTGRPMDMAIDGNGYFVVNNGSTNVFTRVGSFTVDSEFFLVDPSTGYRVQRTGSEGVAERFQDDDSQNIRIPYDVSLPAKQTTTIGYTGNLSADQNDSTTSTTTLTSVTAYTQGNKILSADDLSTVRMDDLDQTSGLSITDTITLYGFKSDGTELGGGAGVDIDLYSGGDYITVQELLDAITAAYAVAGAGSVATMYNGEIQLTDVNSGYSQTDMRIEYNDAGTFDLPNFFTYQAVGGLATANSNIVIYDALGIPHTLSLKFTRTNAPNTWDAVVTSVTGDVELVDRRINLITFANDSGAYNGLGGGTPDTSTLSFRFGSDPNTYAFDVDLGTVGEFNGLTQFGRASTVSSAGQDGYAAGSLIDMTVTNDGVIQGAFSNGLLKNIAALQMATFQNAAGLEAIGNNYFAASANSGDPTETRGLVGGAGAVRGGALEKSNVDVAAEFINMIQAQNGYQSNARTIRVANEMLKELTNLIR